MGGCPLPAERLGSLRPRSPVTIANEVVSIITACQLVGMDLPDDLGMGRTRKLHCPFGDTSHPDFGVDPAFRLYIESNHAYCFAGCGYFTPTRLYAHAVDVHQRAAALDLLERVGYRPVSLAQAWARVSAPESTPDLASLRAALQTFCARVCPTWSVRQFDPDVAQTLGRCLALLDRVRSDADAGRWLVGVKTVMTRVLTDRPLPTASPRPVD